MTGVKIMFSANSNKKFPPASPKNIYSTALVNPASAPQDARVSKKNNLHPNKNTPVFTTGQTMAEDITANVRFFFKIREYVSPARYPHNAPFNKTVTTVPKKSMPKNAPASPVTNTMTANTTPSQSPAIGPQVAAPTTIGKSTRDIENGPKRTNAPKNCNNTTMAVKMEQRVSVWVEIPPAFLLFIKITSCCCFRLGIQRSNFPLHYTTKDEVCQEKAFY